MNRLMVSLFFVVGLCLVFAWSVKPQDQQDDIQQQTDKFLAARRLKELSECNAKVQEWESWWNENRPNYDRVRLTNDELTTENFRLHGKLESQSWVVMQWLFWISAGLGSGVLAMYAVVKSVKWLWPSSAPRKQLFVLILGATWISIAVLLAFLIDRGGPINLVATVSLYSLPAILFGGIGFWWIGKTNEEKS